MRFYVKIILLITIVIKTVQSATIPAFQLEDINVDLPYSEELLNNVTIKFNISDLIIEVGETSYMTLDLSQAFPEPTKVFLKYDYKGHLGQSEQYPTVFVSDLPAMLEFEKFNLSTSLSVKGVSPGHVTVWLNVSNSKENAEDVPFVRINVKYSKGVALLATIMGWICFVCWSLSFYPQPIDNFKYKSVVGLNFDFVLFNAASNAYYVIFNVALFWFPSVKMLYYTNYPRTDIPVALSDCVFAIHALGISLIVVVQCFIYERNNQSVSRLCLLFNFACFLAAFFYSIFAFFGVADWLSFLFFTSYLKLLATGIKCIPQAYSNYQRKSTQGFSIVGILFDLVGAIADLLEIFIMAYNNSEWESMLGNPTKFGLGVLTIFFDAVFMVQHYGLYREKNQPLTANGYISLPSTPIVHHKERSKYLIQKKSINADEYSESSALI